MSSLDEISCKSTLKEEKVKEIKDVWEEMIKIIAHGI